ncbi:MAG: penicillin-binding protein 2 [Alphaproteobacteria bacterium]|nr:penicillin-binding protein 2 [Alphaproteobacteria bacterium]
MTWLSDKIKVFSHRLIALVLFCFLLFLGLMVRIYYLQIIEGSDYKILSDKNRISFQILPPKRGWIYDRNGTPLAVNQKNFRALFVFENLGTSLENFLKRYASISPLSEDEIKRIKKDVSQKKRFMPILIQENLTFDERVKIELNLPDLAGVFVEERVSRYYPFGEIFAHPLGYTGLITEKDNTYNNPLLELPQFKIGKRGIEKFYEEKLRGKEGLRKIEVNVFGREMRELEEKEPHEGEDLTLTLDARLQTKAYNLLKGIAASLVLINVQNGEILASVSTPTFNPNRLQEEWQNLILNPRSPFVDKVVSGLYSPGSTFKMMTGLSALEAGVITPSTKIYCEGFLKVGNHTFYDWNRYGHGEVNLRHALKTSCDVFFYKIAPQTGMDRIATMAEHFGLGLKTGIDVPNEKKGNIPTKNWKEARFNDFWRPGDTVNAGIGQGFILVTPIQLAKMTAEIANGGYEISPHFLKGKEEEKGKSLNVSKRYLKAIQKGMYAVVNEQYGTAYHSRLSDSKYTMSGKTGTTQVKRITLKQREKGKQKNIPYEERDHALFVGFAPSDAPKYAVVVVVEHGGGGSSVAAPLASMLMEEALKLK